MAEALLVFFLTPVATTVWTTGQDATVSLNCTEPYNATFPVILYTSPQNQPVPGLAPLGQISCINSLTIQVLNTIPSGSSYFVVANFSSDLLASVPFTIVNPTTTSRALTATIAPTNGTLTTTSTASSTPKSNNNIDPLNEDSKGNGAAIGGGIAGGVLAVAAVILLLVLRKRQQRKDQPITIKEYGADPPPDYVLPSIEKTRDEPSNKSTTMVKTFNNGLHFVRNN
ncbi:hypothetical protein CPC16_010349 [Podila verticillata]|nr:hypothetical protein CPC16_010349 [Podila verticillata]